MDRRSNPSEKAAPARAGSSRKATVARGAGKVAKKAGSQGKEGRPSDYNEATALAILEQVADGVPLKEICQQPGMPDRGTVRRWRLANADFRTMYAHAREEFADSLADELLGLADNSREGVKTKDGPNGVEVTTGDMVERARLQIDTRKWLASKILPKKYGDKLDLSSSDGTMSPTRVIRPNAPAG